VALFKTGKMEPPPGKAGKWDVVVTENMCKACSFCISICPVDVFAWRDKPNKIGWIPVWVSHEENCVGCMLCYQICPDFCIDVIPKGEPQRKESVEDLGIPQKQQNAR
jgi:2-oxoglutarate ferredoxin oxidoreductase subunit delta